MLVPAAGQAQSLQYPGFYISAEGGVNWMFNTAMNMSNIGGVVNVYPTTGWVVGGSIGYDLVGPRFEVEGVYRSNNGTLQWNAGLGNTTASFNNQ